MAKDGLAPIHLANATKGQEISNDKIDMKTTH